MMLTNTNMNIALIEAHDARVESLMLPMNGSCEVCFEHLAVYKSLGAERFKVWSYRAMLQLDGVTRILVDDSRSDRDYVSDAAVYDGEKELPWVRLLEPSTVTTVRMTFGSGRRLEVQCGHAKLVLLEWLRELEEWHGPLIAPP
jgi:hypothetical protein